MKSARSGLDRVREAIRDLARALLPEPVKRAIRRVRGLGPGGTRVFIQRALTRRVGRSSDSAHPIPAGTRSILVVCRGNVMRSPAAAALLQRGLAPQGIAVRSAGVMAKPGTPADSVMGAVALRHGVSLAEHRAEQVSEALIREHDLILVMDYSNEAAILARFPWAADKLRLLGAFQEGVGADEPEIRDPWGQSGEVMEQCFARMVRHAEALVRQLGAEPS